MIGARRAASMVVDYYSVDTKAQSARGIGDLKALNDQHGSGRTVYEIATDNDNIFAPTDTIMVMGAKGVADSSGEAAPAISSISSRGCDLRLSLKCASQAVRDCT